MVQAHRTSSNLLEPHHHRDNKVFRVFSHEFGVVRLYRTFSNYILCTSSGWFNRIEPPRTFSNLIISEIARCVDVVYMSSVWFDCTEPNFIFTGEAKCAGCFCSSSGWFKLIEHSRTFSNHMITEITRCLEFFHKISGWFDFTEPSLTTSLQGKQGVQGARKGNTDGFSAPYYAYL